GAIDDSFLNLGGYEMMEAAWRAPARTEAEPALDGAIRPVDRREKDVRRVEHSRTDRLERRATFGLGGAGLDRVRLRRAPQTSGPRSYLVRGATEARRHEAREPAGATSDPRSSSAEPWSRCRRSSGPHGRAPVRCRLERP